MLAVVVTVFSLTCETLVATSLASSSVVLGKLRQFLPSYRLLKRLDMPSMKFTIYFMGYEKAEDIPSDETERTKWMFSRKATVELTQ